MATFDLTGPIVMPDGSTPRPNYKVQVTPASPLPGLLGAIIYRVSTLTDADGDFTLPIEAVAGARWNVLIEDPTGTATFRWSFVTPGAGSLSIADLIGEDYTPTLEPSQYTLLASQLGAKADQSALDATDATAAALATMVAGKASTASVTALAAIVDDKAEQSDMDRLYGLGVGDVNLYVSSTTGNDTTGTGATGAPWATIQKAFDSIPKVIDRDYYVNVAAGTYNEEADLHAVSGAAITVQLWGTPPGSPSTSSGMDVKGLAFYDINGRVVVQHVNWINSDTVARRAVLLLSRVAYATVTANRFTGNTPANGTGIPSVEFDGSGGSVGSNHFSGQYLPVASRNGSRVRVDGSNTSGTAATIGIRAEAGIIFKSAASTGIAGATLETTLYGGSIQTAGWVDYTPTYGAAGSMTYTSVTTSFSRYTSDGKTCHFTLRAAGTTGGTASNSIQFSLPVPAYLNQNAAIGAGLISDGTFIACFLVVLNSTTVQVRRYDGANWALGSDRRLYVQGTYEVAQ